MSEKAHGGGHSSEGHGQEYNPLVFLEDSVGQPIKMAAETLSPENLGEDLGADLIDKTLGAFLRGPVGGKGGHGKKGGGKGGHGGH